MQVGAAIEPNPGECYLEDGEEDGQVFQEYNKDTLYVCKHCPHFVLYAANAQHMYITPVFTYMYLDLFPASELSW